MPNLIPENLGILICAPRHRPLICPEGTVQVLCLRGKNSLFQCTHAIHRVDADREWIVLAGRCQFIEQFDFGVHHRISRLMQWWTYPHASCV